MPRAKISFERRICRFAASVSSRSDLEYMACSQSQCTKYSVDVNKYQEYRTSELSATWAVWEAKALSAFRLVLREEQIPLVWIPKEAIDRGLEFVIPGFA